MTFANHPERQFMQYLRGAGWIKARLLPASTLVESLLRKGWIEQQRQGPANEVYFRLTEKGWKPRSPPSRREERAEGEGQIMPPRPSHLPHNLERTALQKLRATRGMLLAQLHPAGPQTISRMLEKGWIERQSDVDGSIRYCITAGGEAALKAKIPTDNFGR